MPTVKLVDANLPMTTATANTTYVLDADESESVTGVMIELNSTEGLTFQLNGSLYATGAVLKYGSLGVAGAAIDVAVGKTGLIDSKYEGLLTYTDGSSIVNKGIVTSNMAEGIEMHGQGIKAANSGTIISDSNDAVYLDGANLRFVNSGSISGGVLIDSDAGASATIINSGRIDNDLNAVAGGMGNDTFVNSGLVRGIVKLSGGEDTFIDKGGRVSGVLQGGDGDDHYVIQSKHYDIRETNGQGIDTLKTSVSWALDDYIEVGRLMGSKDLNLSASITGASIYGNIGDNKLFGSVSADTLDGGRGNDMLTGDGSSDTFAFKARTGDDTITDFTDGADKISLASYKGIDGFGDLGIKQDGDDLVITLHGGDTVTLQNFEKTDLSAADFLF